MNAHDFQVVVSAAHVKDGVLLLESIKSQTKCSNETIFGCMSRLRNAIRNNEMLFHMPHSLPLQLVHRHRRTHAVAPIEGDAQCQPELK